MLKSKAIWTIKESVSDNLIDDLLHQRGITEESEREAFLNPKLEDLIDPAKLYEIDRIKARILEAIEQKEKIMIYGDYDADGVSSTAVLVKALEKLQADVSFYIPNRFTEGYGLNIEAIKAIKTSGYSLIITVDNGITSIEEADYAKEIDLDLIITDHHEVQKELPEAYAILHPKLSKNYAFKELAGVGIAYKLAEYLLDESPVELLQYVALGTIADLVALKGENRVLTYYGLKELNQEPHIGIKALIETSKLEAPYTEEDIGFQIAPRINAVGRLESAELAVELLLSDNLEDARLIAEEIEEINQTRKKIVEDIVKEARKRVTDQGVIILYDKDWHEGVLGIAASRLVSQFDRPVILLNYNEEAGLLKGSARSIDAFDLFKSCMQIRELFLKFGGHAQAAGMTFEYEQLEAIQSQLNRMIFQSLKPEDFKQKIEVAASVDFDALTESLVYDVQALAPFGMGNEKPVFHLKGLPHQIRQIGADKSHLKVQFKAKEHTIDVVAFRKGELYHFISPQAELEVVGQLGINEWNGMRTVQMIADDFQISENQLFDFRGKADRVDYLPFLTEYKNIILSGEASPSLDNIPKLTEASQGSYDLLIINQLPEDLALFKGLLNQIEASTVLASYNLTERKLLHIPSRSEFKDLYTYVYGKGKVNFNREMSEVIKSLKSTRDKIIFMVIVFIESDIFKSTQGVVTLNEVTEKKALEKTKAYKKEVEKEIIETELYYTSEEELKEKIFRLMKNEEIGD